MEEVRHLWWPQSLPFPYLKPPSTPWTWRATELVSSHLAPATVASRAGGMLSPGPPPQGSGGLLRLQHPQSKPSWSFPVPKGSVYTVLVIYGH